MSKKFNNNTLLIILVALIAVFFLVKWYQKSYTDNTLNANLVQIDTAKVSKIVIYPVVDSRSEIRLFRDGKDWKVAKGNVTSETESNTPTSLLGMLSEIKTKRLASKDKSKWADFNLTDTAATRVKVYEGNDVVLDLLIGRFSYQQGNSQYGGMYGGGGTGTTYVRLNGKNEVYAIDGFLTFSFNQKFSAFRKQTLAKLDMPNITKVTFKYPADSGYVLELRDKSWSIGNIKVDSANVANYLNSVNYKNATSFVDNYSPVGMPACQLTFEGKDMKPLVIDAWMRSNNDYILNSNRNAKSWFGTNNNGLFQELFKGKKYFLDVKKPKKK